MTDDMRREIEHGCIVSRWVWDAIEAELSKNIPMDIEDGEEFHKERIAWLAEFFITEVDDVMLDGGFVDPHDVTKQFNTFCDI